MNLQTHKCIFPLYIIMAMLWMFCSCSNSRQTGNQLTLSVLRGPSAIVFAQWMIDPPVVQGKRLAVKVVDSPQLMQAAMIKEETDIAVLPMVSAANLYNKGIDYRLAGCPIWGTLYLVEHASIDPADHTLHLFGAGTTPEMLTRHYLAQVDSDAYRLDFTFGTPRELLQALYAGRVKRAVLSEPFIGMAQRRDSAFRVVADLNRLTADSTEAFAQTAVVYHPSLQPVRHQLDSLLAQSCSFVNEHPQQAIEVLEKQGLFAPGSLTPQTLKRCRIQYRTAEASRRSINSLLRLIYQYEPKAVGGRLPDNGFIQGLER